MICGFTRRALSSALDRGRPLPGWTERHLGRCAGCRGFEERLALVDAALFATADDAPTPRAAARPRRAAALIAVAAAALGAAAVLALRPQRDPAPPPAPTAVAAPAPPRILLSLANRVVRRVAGDRAERLEDEAERLVEDTRAGVRRVLRLGGITRPD